MQLYTSTRTWYSGPHCPCESGILFFQRQVLTDGLSLWFNNSACENWIGQFPPLWVLKDGWFSLPGCFVAVSFLFHIIFIFLLISVRPIISKCSRPIFEQQNTLVVPRYRLTTYGRRAFSVAGPTAWNSFPVAFRDPTISDACFWRHLKTVLFAQQRRHHSV